MHNADHRFMAAPLPVTAQDCRIRLTVLQDEIASIRIQVATTDIRRQAEKKPLDPAWYHRAKTALRLKQQEYALVSAQLSRLSDGGSQTRRDRFKDALIEVLKSHCDDQQWADAVSRARVLQKSLEDRYV